MAICQPHNLVTPIDTAQRFGIKVSLRSNDPFRNLVGDTWTKEHWFASARERDEALTEMSQKYVYFRPGDRPSLLFTKIEK
jgi:hypothetical protein